MKSDKLKKTKEKQREIKKIEMMLKRKNTYAYLIKELVHVELKNWAREPAEKSIIIDRQIIEPALIAYRDKLKAELKELGYEE